MTVKYIAFIHSSIAKSVVISLEDKINIKVQSIIKYSLANYTNFTFYSLP